MSRPATLRLALYQFAPTMLDVEGNASRIARAARAARASILLTPELSLTGYDLRDDAADVALPVEPGFGGALGSLHGAPDAILGLVERTGDGALFNTAVHVRSGAPLFRHRKVYLPTYGPFDEARFFGRGHTVRTYDLDGWRLGLLICEDFWHPSLAYLLAMAGAQVLLVQSAAPGLRLRHADDGPDFESSATWERIARTTAQLYGVYVALANRTGVEGAVTFAGGSMIVGPDGQVLERAPQSAESVLAHELSLDEVARARRPFSHRRDEDLSLVYREMGRLLEREDE